MRTRSEIPKEEQWNVGALYATPQDWKKEFDSVKGKSGIPHWPNLRAYEGKLKESPHMAAEFFDLFFALDRKLSKLQTYARLKLDEDLGNDSAKRDEGLVSSLAHDFELECSWVEPELISMSDRDYKKFSTDERLKNYRFYLEKIERMRSHVLKPELEELVALSKKALETAYRSFGALNNADMTFSPAETSSGEKRELTTGTYLVYLRDPDRALRKTAFINLHRGYESYENTLCELIQGQVQSHLFLARAKKFHDCREAALFPNAIEPVVYDNLIATIHRNLDVLHRYMRLRKELLKLDELHPYDLYVPFIEETQMQMEFSDACQLVIEAMKPLGDSYVKELRKGLLEDGWVDPMENQRKRSGAYSGGCYDSMPYILMNYHGTLNDILTLAHEAGHSMHSFLSRTHQPYVYADYPIFVAEVASTLNEQLLLNFLKTKAKGKRERAYLVNYEIEGIRTTIFRQPLFAEFELQLHRWAEESVALTPSLLKDAYRTLNRLYYGPDLVLDGGIECEWARIPHFYYDFYVYQYATGLSAALALYEKISHSPDTVKQYLQFLSSGGSRYPLDLLQIAGVDLRKGAPIEDAMKHFRELVDELEQLMR